MAILFAGSNPGVLFFDEFEKPIALASLWIADWTPQGSGTALIIADAQGWRSYGEDETLAYHLADRFTRHFPEAAAFQWTGVVRHLNETLEIDLDPETHVNAISRSIELRIWDVLDARTTTAEAFPLGELSPRLTNVYIPCASAILIEFGKPVAGMPKVEKDGDRASSTAYLAIAEVWEET